MLVVGVAKMEFPYKLDISSDKMKAWIIPAVNDRPESVSAQDLEQWLQNLPIKYGIREEVKSHLVNIEQSVFPLLIAIGKYPKNGEDGKVELAYTKGTDKQEQPFNFRNIIDIPSVSTGEIVATVTKPTIGEYGIDLFGNKIKPKPGKKALYKLGLNVMEHESVIYSTIEGQISIAGHTIQVNPVFLVKGDLSLKVGNIDFIGNVSIEGNVPVGYTVRCGGDLKVYGMIEGSTIDVGGSIYVNGGITGEKECYVRSGGDLNALYLNHVSVETGGNITIEKAILHSKVISSQSVACNNGHLIGGILRAGKKVELHDAGNIHYTRTEIHIGNKEAIELKKQEMDDQYKKMESTFSKLTYIAVKLEEKLKNSRDEKDLILLEKQRKTKNQLAEKMKKLKYERFRLDYHLQADEELIINGTCYPNLYIKMGKYSTLLNQPYHSVKFTDKGNEIAVYPL